jgi:hypothetical protein
MGVNYNTGKIITDGLVLYLDAANSKSYPGSGTTWTDLSGNNNHGTLVNGVGYSSDNNGSLVFDGVNDRTTISGSASGLNIVDQITMISWVKPVVLKSGWQGIFLRQTVGQYELWIFDNKLRYGLNTGSGTGRASGNIQLFNNFWYMLCWTYDGSAVRLYVNTIADSVFNRTGTIPTSTRTFFIGYSGFSSEYFNGNIGVCQLYSRALTAQEIRQNYNATRSRYNI